MTTVAYVRCPVCGRKGPWNIMDPEQNEHVFEIMIADHYGRRLIAWTRHACGPETLRGLKRALEQALARCNELLGEGDDE